MLQNGVLCQFLISFLLKNFKEKAIIFPLVLTCFNRKEQIQLQDTMFQISEGLDILVDNPWGCGFP